MSKSIYVFSNTNNDCGQRFVVNSHKLYSWQMLLNYITDCSCPYIGLVKDLYTTEGVLVKSFEELKTNGKYVVSTTKNFKMVHRRYLTKEEQKALYRDKFEFKNKNKLCTIYVFINGESQTPPKKFVITEYDLNDWNFMLSYISECLGIPATKSLYTISGVKIDKPWELDDKECYVAVSWDEEYIPAPYYCVHQNRNTVKINLQNNLNISITHKPHIKVNVKKFTNVTSTNKQTSSVRNGGKKDSKNVNKDDGFLMKKNLNIEVDNAKKYKKSKKKDVLKLILINSKKKSNENNKTSSKKINISKQDNGIETILNKINKNDFNNGITESPTHKKMTILFLPNSTEKKIDKTTSINNVKVLCYCSEANNPLIRNVELIKVIDLINTIEKNTQEEIELQEPIKVISIGETLIFINGIIDEGVNFLTLSSYLPVIEKKQNEFKTISNNCICELKGTDKITSDLKKCVCETPTPSDDISIETNHADVSRNKKPVEFVLENNSFTSASVNDIRFTFNDGSNSNTSKESTTISKASAISQFQYDGYRSSISESTSSYPEQDSRTKISRDQLKSKTDIVNQINKESDESSINNTSNTLPTLEENNSMVSNDISETISFDMTQPLYGSKSILHVKKLESLNKVSNDEKSNTESNQYGEHEQENNITKKINDSEDNNLSSKEDNNKMVYEPATNIGVINNYVFNIEDELKYESKKETTKRFSQCDCKRKSKPYNRNVRKKSNSITNYEMKNDIQSSIIKNNTFNKTDYNTTTPIGFINVYEPHVEEEIINKEIIYNKCNCVTNRIKRRLSDNKYIPVKRNSVSSKTPSNSSKNSFNKKQVSKQNANDPLIFTEFENKPRPNTDDGTVQRGRKCDCKVLADYENKNIIYVTLNEENLTENNYKIITKMDEDNTLSKTYMEPVLSIGFIDNYEPLAKEEVIVTEMKQIKCNCEKFPYYGEKKILYIAVANTVENKLTKNNINTIDISVKQSETSDKRSLISIDIVSNSNDIIKLDNPEIYHNGKKITGFTSKKSYYEPLSVVGFRDNVEPNPNEIVIEKETIKSLNNNSPTQASKNKMKNNSNIILNIKNEEYDLVIDFTGENRSNVDCIKPNTHENKLTLEEQVHLKNIKTSEKICYCCKCKFTSHDIKPLDKNNCEKLSFTASDINEREVKTVDLNSESSDFNKTDEFKNKDESDSTLNKQTLKPNENNFQYLTNKKFCSDCDGIISSTGEKAVFILTPSQAKKYYEEFEKNTQ